MAGTLATLRILLLLDTSSVTAGLAQVKGQIAGANQQLQTAIGAAAVAGVVGIGLAIDQAIKWQDSFAGVARTVDVSNKSLSEQHQIMGDLESDLRDVARTIPMSHEAITNIAELAGALGVEAPDIAPFTKLAGTIASLSDDLSPEETAYALGKIRTVLGLATKDFGAFGSALVAVGMKGASTEGEILSLTERMAGIAGTLKISTPDVLAWGAAIANTGERSEAGGSSFQRMGLLIQKASIQGGASLHAIASAAGDSDEAFKELFASDSSQAMQDYINGLAGMDAETRFTTMSLAKMGDVRITRMILKLVQAIQTGTSGDLNQSIETANEGWEDRNRIWTIAAERWDTSSKKIDILINNLVDLGITFGTALLPYVDMVVDGFTGIAGGLNDMMQGSEGLMSALAPVITLFTTFLALKFGSKLLTSFLPIGGAGKLLAGAWGGVFSQGIAKPAAAAGAAAGAAAQQGFLARNGNKVGGAMAGVGTGIAVVGAATGNMDLEKFGSLITMFGVLLTFTNPFVALAAAFAVMGAEIINLGKSIQFYKGEYDLSTSNFLETLPTASEAQGYIANINKVHDSLGMLERTQFDLVGGGDQLKYETERIQKYIDGLAHGLDPAAAAAAAGIQKFAKVATSNLSAAEQKIANMTDEMITQIQTDFADLTKSLAAEATWDIPVPKEDMTFKSFKKRLAGMIKYRKYLRRQLKLAIKAGDSVAATELVTKIGDAGDAIESFKTNGKIDAGALTTYMETRGIKIGNMFDGVVTDADTAKIGIDTAMDAAKASVMGSVAGMSTAVASTSLYNAGQHMVGTYIGGIKSQWWAAHLAGLSIAGAVSGPLAFSRPPKTGPLHGIRAWMPHMVKQWLSPMGHVLRTANAAGLAMGGAIAPKYKHKWAGAHMDDVTARRKKETHVHVGTLIANDKGVDELERRMNNRKRIKKRNRRNVDSPNGMNR